MLDLIQHKAKLVDTWHSSQGYAEYGCVFDYFWDYLEGYSLPHYPVPAIAYDFTDVINGECVMLTYRNRSDVKAPWRIAYEYPSYIE